MVYILAAAGAFGLLGGLWQACAPGPRRRRAFARAESWVNQGNWQDALEVVDELRSRHAPSLKWQRRLRLVAAQCHEAGGEAAIRELRFEEALEHWRQAANLQESAAAAEQDRIVEAMLAEVHRLFSLPDEPAQSAALEQLLARVFAMQPVCPEASFWQGLCQARQGQLDTAASAWTTAHDQSGKQFMDPPFYLGMLLHRRGKPQEALRFLSEANRLDPGCPPVTCQTGVCLVAAQGDSGTAVRTLQRGLGPRGLEQWYKAPEGAWFEAFPEGKSYVRRMAAGHRYVCPFLGRDLTQLARQAQMALAQAHYRLGAFEEAAGLFTQMLQESPPTAAILRGLGMALARRERYDEAYRHLRTALELEEPKDPLTGGYLALCGAHGKPTQPDDRPKNVAWALRLLARYPLSGNAEWADLCGAVQREARAIGLAISREDQLLLCDALAALDAADIAAAAAYAHLFSCFPDSVRSEHAWLYVRAASQGQAVAASDLALFDRAWRDGADARAFFTRHNWDLSELLYTYLACAAEQRPGSFPTSLGAEFPAQGTELLLSRSRQEEAAGRLDAALACAEVLRRLAPDSVAALDRLACLHFRRGELARAAALLQQWHVLDSANPLPFVRRAIIEQQRGDLSARDAALDAAAKRTSGRGKAAVAFLAARLVLQDVCNQGLLAATRTASTPEKMPPAVSRLAILGKAIEWLQACLRRDPNHADALWCLAATQLALGDRRALAAQAPLMNRTGAMGLAFHYLSGICNLAAGDAPHALAAAERAALNPGLAADCAYLRARAHLRRGDQPAARVALAESAGVPTSLSAPLARALLAQCAFCQGEFAEAMRRWLEITPGERTSLRLDEPLRQTALLAGLHALREGKFQMAADFVRRAGRLGLRDPRLGGLLVYALVKTGQSLLYDLKNKTDMMDRKPSASTAG